MEKKAGRTYQALSRVSRHDCIGLTSKQLSRLVGHLIRMWCISRQLLAMPSAAYDFIQRGFHKAIRRWCSVQRELRCAQDTLFFCGASVKSPLSCIVRAMDTCPTGCALVGNCCDRNALESFDRLVTDELIGKLIDRGH